MVGDRAPLFSEWLMAPIRRNKWVYARVALAAAMISIFALVTSLFSMTVYDRVIPNNAMSSLTALAIGMGIVVIFDFVLKILRGYFVDVAGADVDSDIGDRVFDRILALRMEARQGSTGALSGLMRELESLRDFFASATLTAIVDVPFILLTIFLMWVIGGSIVIVPLIAVPVVILTAWLTNPALDRMSSQVLRHGLNKQSVLVEAIGGLEAVKVTGAANLLRRRWSVAVREHAGTALKQRLVSTIGVTVAGSVQTVAYAAIIVMGVSMIADSKMTMGGLIACSILSGRVLAPLAQIAQLLTRLNTTRVAYRALDEIMQQPTENEEGQGLRLTSLKGGIELRNLSFKYPGAQNKTLDGINITIQPGEKVALLGRVGSGKSTIARLVMGLYPADEGVVLLDGNAVRAHDLNHMRRYVGAVLQDTVLFTGSIRDNICLGRPWVDENEMIRAATVSGTHQFAGSLVNGYELQLADRGEGLSGGQRQSIAVARALAGKPPVLILDEPSSAMDPQTEGQLIAALQAEAADRTVLLITHHPSLLALVSRIILLDKGKVIADGPREAILKQLTRQPVKEAAPAQ